MAHVAWLILLALTGDVEFCKIVGITWYQPGAAPDRVSAAPLQQHSHLFVRLDLQRCDVAGALSAQAHLTGKL